jgi:cytochrome c peroxidase
MNSNTRRAATTAILFLAGLLIGIPSRATSREEQAADPSDLAALKELYRRPPPRGAEDQQLVELGGKLFWDPRISASGRTSCGSCHLPDLAWATRDAKSVNDSGKLTSRKSQPLIGIGYMEPGTPVGWDGRNAGLEAQVKSSISTGSMSMRETGAPVAVEVIEARIRAIPDYAALFQAALPGRPIDLALIGKAVAAYERTIEPGTAPFDLWVEGDDAAISDAAKRGFILFNTKAGCAACHGGWRFTEDSFHDIGSTETDLGRGRDVKDDVSMQHAFKTPTLRSVAVRPPYLHTGAEKTLEDVVKFYERGGIDRPSRSPLIAPLDLTEQDRADLVAFLETLTGVADGALARRPAQAR